MQGATARTSNSVEEQFVNEQKFENFFIEHIRQISEVESVYKLREDGVTTILTILKTEKYNRDVNMKIYELEYHALEKYPDTTLNFQCIPRLELSDEEFLPRGVTKIFER